MLYRRDMYTSLAVHQNYLYQIPILASAMQVHKPEGDLILNITKSRADSETAVHHFNRVHRQTRRYKLYYNMVNIVFTKYFGVSVIALSLTINTCLRNV